MPGLAPIKDANQGGKIVFINPQHIISVQEVATGTQVKLSDGSNLATPDNVKVVVAAIQVAMTT
jgi:hypothetical protein